MAAKKNIGRRPDGSGRSHEKDCRWEGMAVCEHCRRHEVLFFKDEDVIGLAL